MVCFTYLFIYYLFINLSWQNTCKIYHFKVYNSVALSTFTVFFNHHHYLVREFLSPQTETLCPSAIAPCLPLSHPLPATISLLPLWVCLFWIFYINLIIQYMVFWDRLLTLYNTAFKVFRCCST